MTTPVSDAGGIPVNDAQPVLSYGPFTMAVPGRLVDLQVKVSMPESGDNLPVILMSHGHGMATFLSSLRGYGPLVDFWAAHGFVVIQPTHLDSTALGLREVDDPEAPLFWRTRATDMHHILDHLDEVEATVPGLAGRLDRDRIAVAGHSLGGNTASLLLGMRAVDPADGSETDLHDDRIKAGVVLAAPGVGDDGHLASFAAENYPVFKHLDFSTMTAPALVIAGDPGLELQLLRPVGLPGGCLPVQPGAEDHAHGVRSRAHARRYLWLRRLGNLR